MVFTRHLINYIEGTKWATIRFCIDPFRKAYFLNVLEERFFKCILESQALVKKVAPNMTCHIYGGLPLKGTLFGERWLPANMTLVGEVGA